MNFLKKKEYTQSNKFLTNGYIISKTENRKSIYFLKSLIKAKSEKLLNKKKIDINKIHKYVSVDNLNEFRLEIIYELNKNKLTSFHYFNSARNSLYNLAGNELMMQKNINLSIQMPNDESSLLPIHSDVWSGDSPYEINLWLPLVNCFNTKSMYILEKKFYDKFVINFKKKKAKNSSQIFSLVKKKVKWINIKYGEFLLFDQSLPHGNVINKENETRWSMNCRFKSFFSPYGDKKIGEFFLPITTRAMTKVGLNFKNPFVK